MLLKSTQKEDRHARTQNFSNLTPSCSCQSLSLATSISPLTWNLIDFRDLYSRFTFRLCIELTLHSRPFFNVEEKPIMSGGFTRKNMECIQTHCLTQCRTLFVSNVHEQNHCQQNVTSLFFVPASSSRCWPSVRMQTPVTQRRR